MDSRTDLPKVRYATALDWFLLMSFFYCIATLLEFAGVHYFTKVGSGEIHALTDDEWEDGETTIEHAGVVHVSRDMISASTTPSSSTRKRNSIICPIYNVTEFHFTILKVKIENFNLSKGSNNNVSTNFIAHVNYGTNYSN